MRIIELEDTGGRMLLTADSGDFAFLDGATAQQLADGALSSSHASYPDLVARGLVAGAPTDRFDTAAIRTRKSFLLEGPALHIFVVTLRCDHSCQYCQVSRAGLSATGKDMNLSQAMSALDRVFESPAKALTVEIQGGEPALRFDLVRAIVLAAEDRNASEARDLRFTMATTLHLLDEDALAFCRDHHIHLSTSIDGASPLHTHQRPNPTRDSASRTIEALDRARSILGHEAVAALPTLTRAGLLDPIGLIETYRELGFAGIFLRPLSPFGFAQKTRRSLGYPMSEFLTFYGKALDYILDLNRRGIEFQEWNAATLLRHILTPFHSGYMDLRSPSAAGLGVLVYNYDGQVYPSDEARMAAETGDARFALGTVETPLTDLLQSPAMRWLARGAVAEQQAHCASCAFVPYCGADPVHHAVTQGEPDADRATSEFCAKYKGLFTLLFRKLAEGDPETLQTFTAWAFRRPRASIYPDLLVA